VIFFLKIRAPKGYVVTFLTLHDPQGYMIFFLNRMEYKQAKIG
jgi:hypothetical protein